MGLEHVCPRCSYRTTRPRTDCPICAVPLDQQERTWTGVRRAVRVPLPAGVQGTLDDHMPVTILDLSPLGARLEHADVLLPGLGSLLTLAVPGVAPLRLPARIVWSRAHYAEAERPGTGWLYHSGVEFWKIPSRVEQVLRGYLDRMARGSAGDLHSTLVPSMP